MYKTNVSLFAAAAIALVSLPTAGRAQNAGAPSGVFGNGHAYYHAVRVAPYRFLNTIVRLHFNVPRALVYGDETATVSTKNAQVRDLPFNSAGIHVQSIAVDGRRVRYTEDRAHETLHIPVDAGAAGTRITIEFRYWAAPPRGLYFIRPDSAYPHIVPEIWTQGEPIDNRRWFPTWDEPNEKTPSELIVTVPRGWTVIANGYLKSHTAAARDDTWDWNSPKPKSTYLISFAAGPLVKYHSSLGALDVDSFVQPQYAALNAQCFRHTKDAIAYFDRIIGVPYPWEKYDQTTAERYVYGGMEDVSATLLTALTLHPAIEEPESGCDILISHELAQEWWGDDATMTDWGNVWLHEGFATYYDELWSGKRFGESEFEYRRHQAGQAYFQETRQYLRPIVDRTYADPLDVFDASSHQRPGAVLHMLRYLFGDAKFFGATRAYLLKYALRNADTDDFFHTVEAYLGTDLSWFEDEWFERRDYPNFLVGDAYDATAHALAVTVKQRNIDGQPYRMPIVIEVYWGTAVTRVRPLIERNDQTIRIPNVGAPPDMVLFDPNENILKKLTFSQPVRRLAYQLAHAAHIGDREWALEQLAGMTHAQNGARLSAMNAVARSATSDPFYGVRADAMAAAASFNDAATVGAGLRDADTRVRLAAEAAAAGLDGAPSSVIGRLRELADDPNPDCAAAALTALGALKAPGHLRCARTGLESRVIRRSGRIGSACGSCRLRRRSRARSHPGTYRVRRP
ncbi:MAG TPA: M1 family aminopeptidase [Candidatus Baltobacteraceae bacterium]|nr:M1 family aminopeptidase [Candidatus Baltobacteraceae bacterium]